MRSTMMRDGLSLNDLLERAGRLHGESQIVSRLPDKSLVRHSFALPSSGISVACARRPA